MNLQESIRKDLSIIFEEEKPLTFIVDRGDLIYWFFYESLEYEQIDDVREFENDFMSEVADGLLKNKELTIRVTVENFLPYLRYIPTELIKNISVIRREHPQVYDHIIDMKGLEVDDSNRHRLDIRG